MTKLLLKKFFLKIVISFLFVGNLADFYAQQLEEKPLKKIPTYTLKEAKNLPKEEVIKLKISKLNLTELPEEIYHYKNLRYLDASNNNFTEIPLELTSLIQLEYLNFSSNKLTTLSDKINQFKVLKVLLLNHNEIVTLPTEISELTHLTELHLWGTLLVSLPSSIINLKDTLKVIDLRFVPMSKMEHKKWRKLLKNTKIAYSLKCNCD